jgi:hypothetical protein
MRVDRDFIERREAIRSAFPTLTLKEVYGAIKFHLGHRHEADEDLAARSRARDAACSRVKRMVRFDELLTLVALDLHAASPE